MKYLMNSRLLDKYYLIIIDGTGHLSFGETRHCKHCLSAKNKETKKTYYYHNVLDAKIIGPDGMVLSTLTESIENPEGGLTRQDCELRAFYRLAEKLKKKFPQLNMCLLLDGLYGRESVIEVCEKYNWKYIITFKEGSMPEVWQEFEAIKRASPENYAEHNIDDTKQKYRWAEDIMQYKSSYKVNALECIEKSSKGEANYFAWITNFNINKNNFYEIGKGGRLRWKIENEGFNMQKNGGYELEHAYCLDSNAIKNFYLLLQIAHIISQLMEKGKMSVKQIQKKFGSIKNFSRRLLESLRNFIIPLTTPILTPLPPIDSS